MKQLAIVGTGKMAGIRGNAIIKTKKGQLCGVCSRDINHSARFAKEYACGFYTDNYRELIKVNPDAILIETPHDIQNEIINWALDENINLFIGGVPAASINDAKKIQTVAKKKNLVVEAGFECRYKEVWEELKNILDSKQLGNIINIQSIALFPVSKDSWYYDETQSGGMPVSHMTYAFINPLNWLLGEPKKISGIKLKHNNSNGTTSLKEDFIVANFLYGKKILLQHTAGYIAPNDINEDIRWNLKIFCVKGVIEVYPSDIEGGKLIIMTSGKKNIMKFNSNNSFIKQADCFLDALNGKNLCKNTPDFTLKYAEEGGISTPDTVTVLPAQRQQKYEVSLTIVLFLFKKFILIFIIILIIHSFF